MRNRTAFGALVTTLVGSFGLVVSAAPPAAAVVSATPLVISEFRLRGPSGENDEFVEIYNAGGADHTVTVTDASAGYSLVASDGTARFTIPAGTVIPARGHYLGVNSVAYSLAAYPASDSTTATGDATWTTDIPINTGIALFNTATPANFTLANRLDAVGSTTEANTLYREGVGHPPLSAFSIDQSLYRRQDSSNTIVDSDDNATDFLFVDTNGTSAGAGQRLGAPGPENLSSPPFHGSATLAMSVFDPGAGPYAAPNYVRDLTSTPAQNSTFGTILLRRKITNNTGASITRLRIKLSDQSTFPAPSGLADLRGRTSSDETVPLTGGGTAPVEGTTVEAPPSQPNGTGFNSTLSVPDVTSGSPLANGASINLNLLFGSQQTGLWRLGLEFDTLPGGGLSVDLCGKIEMSTPRPADSCTVPPVNTAPASRSLVGATSFTGGALAVTDYDEDTSLKVTLTATDGTLTLSTTGLTFSAGDGTDDATTTFTGTIADINTALDTLVYTATPGFLGAATLTITSDDEGHTWPTPHVDVVDPASTDTDVVNLTVGTLQISEFRLRGPNGANDEFVEIRNPMGTAITVQSSDGSSGFALAASNGVARFVIPNGTVIPAFGHYLGVNSVGYSLASYPADNATTATGDATYTTDIPDNAGIALFNLSTAASFALANRIDAVGSTSEANTLYKEGTGWPALTPFSIDHAFYRSLASGTDADTDNNAVDFVFVDTNGTSAGAGQRLGAPGPENLSSPTRDGSLSNVPVSRFDTGAGYLAAPNFVRDLTSVPAQNSTFGTISIRRKITNNTGSPITRMRFRVREILTFPAPSGYADLRPRTSTDIVASLTGGGTAPVSGTTLEQPPSQPNGGGFNSSLSAPAVTAGTPLADGASIDVQWLFGIQQTGLFRIGMAVETLDGGSSTFVLCGHTDSDNAAAIGDVCPQPPVVTVPGTQSTTGTTPVIFGGGTAITVADADDNSLKVSLLVGDGTLSLFGTTGLTFTTGDGSDDAAMVFSGTKADINNALSGLTYVADGGFAGAESLSIIADDEGSTWPAVLLGVTDPPSTDTELVTIDVGGATGDFFPLSPARILDTRTGLGAPLGKVGPNGTITLDVTGVGGVPATGVSAVYLNVTETGNTSTSHITVYPSELALPSTSNLNFAKGQTKANSMVVRVGPAGTIKLRNAAGSTHIIADVFGYSTSSLVAGGGRFEPLPKPRIVDTRHGVGVAAGPLGPGDDVTVKLTDANGVPASGVSGVLLNMTAVLPTAGGHLTVHPSNVALPSTSNINFQPGRNIANLLLARVSPSGEVTIHNSSGFTHVVFDLLGYYTDGTGAGPTGGTLEMLTTPARVVDSRIGLGSPATPVGSGATRTIDLTGVGGIPAGGVGAVILNLTTTLPSTASHMTQYPNGETRPNTSSLNWVRMQTANNYVVAKVGPGGLVDLFNFNGTVHAIVDVVGYYVS